MGRKVLWVGGTSGVGKTWATHMIARRYDVWLYAVDARTYEHAEAMQVPALTMTPDQLWLDRSPEEMAADFVEEARRRFPLIRADIDAIRQDGAPVIVEGPQLLPDLVPAPALFIVASPELQRDLLRNRESLTYSATSDPARAFANRARRDELLALPLRSKAVEIRDVRDTEGIIEAFVREHADHWIRSDDRGDVAVRRRLENEQYLEQWRRYAEHEPRAREGQFHFACECDQPGCPELVPLTYADALAHRPEPFLAHS
jgi:hypothetical protein